MQGAGEQVPVPREPTLRVREKTSKKMHEFTSDCAQGSLSKKRIETGCMF